MRVSNHEFFDKLEEIGFEQKSSHSSVLYHENGVIEFYVMTKTPMLFIYSGMGFPYQDGCAFIIEDPTLSRIKAVVKVLTGEEDEFQAD